MLGAPARTHACDICAIYTATEMWAGRVGFRLGVAEQVSSFATLQEGGEEVDNPDDEHLTSSITQVLFGYNLSPRFGVQLNVPIISRTFRRVEENGIVHGDATGIGDVSLLADVLAFNRIGERSLLRVSLLGGLKLPSGDSDRLGEEIEEEDEDGEEEGALRAPRTTRARVQRGSHTAAGPHTEEQSGIHGHDLALGSGSVDGIIGGRIFWSWRRLFVTTAAQWAIRTEGAFDYRYADDLTWSGGPGGFVLLDHERALALQALFSGETKGEDTLGGATLDDTAITALYLGPGITLTWGTSLAADLAADLPVLQNNSGLQIVPDFRLRGGVTWRF
jgi:hypothetical protein